MPRQLISARKQWQVLGSRQVSLSKLLWGSHIQHGRIRLLDLKKSSSFCVSPTSVKMRGASNFLLRFFKMFPNLHLGLLQIIPQTMVHWIFHTIFGSKYIPRFFRSICHTVAPGPPVALPQERFHIQKAILRPVTVQHKVLPNGGTKKGEEKWCFWEGNMTSLIHWWIVYVHIEIYFFYIVYTVHVCSIHVDVNVGCIHMPQWSRKIPKAFD